MYQNSLEFVTRLFNETI